MHVRQRATAVASTASKRRPMVRKSSSSTGSGGGREPERPADEEASTADAVDEEEFCWVSTSEPDNEPDEPEPDPQDGVDELGERLRSVRLASEAEKAPPRSDGPASSSKEGHIPPCSEPRDKPASQKQNPSAAAASSAEPDPHSKKQAAAGDAPPQADVPGLAPVPWYVVWDVPGAADLRGLHGGPSSWANLARQIPGGKYRTGRDHLRRAKEGFEQALEVYQNEAARHGAPLPPPVFWWP